MADVTNILLGRYEGKRKGRASVRPSEPEPQRRAYQQAAAVLHCFTPEMLQPVAANLRSENPRLLLFDDIVRAAGERSGRLFTLKTDVRRRALAQLSTRDAMLAALHANPRRPETPLQRMWEDYLRTGSMPAAESLGYRQLMNLSQILWWLNDLDPQLPEQTYVLDLVRRRTVLASFEHLVDRNFTGRVEELALLRDHIGALPPETGLQAVRRQLSQWLKVSRKPILAIHGSGGIGKSALVGRMLWEHAQAEAQACVPFAYLAFDQRTLRVETPFTLLVEAAAQFELQLPEHEGAIQQFRNEVRKFRDARGALGKRQEGSASRGGRISEVHHLDRQLHLDFATLLARIGSRALDAELVRIPVLIVLDTFEEVQYRDRESLTGFWRMLDTIQQAYPPFRVVISGRGPVSGLGAETQNVKEVRLEELDLEDRVTLLQRLGVSDPSTAQAVAEQVGGNPLSLHLAANVITSDPQAAGSKGIADLTTRKWLVFQIDEQIVQGQLYRRILDHIHDENVRKLAHPGMVLRRVTPEVILEVLAPLCLDSVTEPAEAERLFEELKREYALVTSDVDGALVYRTEIRRAMVRLLEQDRYPEVRELRRAAIDYYSKQEGVAARAEEIYHRLALGEDDVWQLDSRWMPGIESSVAASIEEYPDRIKAWLASRMNLEVPRSVFANADTAEWERNITRKVQRALSELQFDWALKLLAERPDRTDASPLFALEAKTHLLRNDLDSAGTVLERGIERVSRSTNRGRLAELFWLQSQVALLRGQPEEADRSLARAEQAVENAGNPVPLMHILGHRMLLRRGHPARYPENAAQLRPRLNRVCERIDETRAYSAGFVVSLALSVLENEFPKTTERLASLAGPQRQSSSGDPLTGENLQGLEEYRELWERETDQSPEAAA